MLYAPISRLYTETYQEKAQIDKLRPFCLNRNFAPNGMGECLAYLHEWKKRWHGDCFCYEYHFWLHQYYEPTGLYIAKVIYDDIRGLHAHGLRGIIEDASQRSFFPNGFAFYVYGETLFDGQVRFEELREDYFSHAYGETAEENCENTAWAVSRLLANIPIDGYLALDMGGIAALNDALGGVTVTLEEDFSALDPQMVRGATIALQGKQAETFVRGRTGVGDGTNAARMKRQKAFMQKAGDLIAEGLERDSGFAGTLLDALSGHMTMNVTRGWLINKAYESSGYRRTETRTLAGTHALGADGFTEFRADTDALNDLLTASFFE